jgi:hypothetical protein
MTGFERLRRRMPAEGNCRRSKNSPARLRRQAWWNNQNKNGLRLLLTPVALHPETDGEIGRARIW